MNPRLRPLVVAGTVLLTIACQIVVSSTAIPGPPPTLEPTAPVLVPTSTTVVTEELCPVPASEPAPPDLSPGIDLIPNLLSYLNAGGPLSTLVDLLAAAYLLPQRGQPPAQADVDGNGYLDIALAVIDPSSEFLFPPAGSLSLFTCSDGRYALSYASPLEADNGGPEIYAAQDLNGDRAAELLTGRTSCGAHTCFTQFEVLVWRDRTLENRLQGNSDDLPNPTVELEMLAGEETYSVIVTATGIGSVGAGPFHQFQRAWSWDPGSQFFLPSADADLPSPWRIHTLYYADRAALEGDLETALRSYQQVIDDDSLQDWEVDPDSRGNVTAYAMFRRILTFLQLEQVVSAQGALDTLRATFPAGRVGEAFVALGEVFWDQHQSSGSLIGACAAARAYAEANAELILDPLYHGYANPTYQPADICPIDS